MLRISFIIFLCGCCSANAQDIKKYVQSNTVAVRTISPDSLDFSDLEALGNAIGSARIVMLGEQDHGDAPTFLAKTRIIKYLHETKGFDVLAFESDFFSLNQGWDNLIKSPGSVDSFIHANIFPIWTGCDACRPLFRKYVPASYNTATPIIMTGFDNQMMLKYSRGYFVKTLDSVLRAFDLPVTKKNDYTSLILPVIDSLNNVYGSALPFVIPGNCENYLKEIKSELSAKISKDNFWNIILDNLLATTDEYKNSGSSSYEKMNIARDRQMALNLRWLSEIKYPGKKIIVWAHNYHIGKFCKGFTANRSAGAATMGSFFTDDSTDFKNTFILGFTSYDGTAGRLGTPDFKIISPKKNSFETWIDENYAYAFTDFTGYRRANETSEKFYLKGLFHNNVHSEWATVFDGVFFIRHMYPCLKK